MLEWGPVNCILFLFIELYIFPTAFVICNMCLQPHGELRDISGVLHRWLPLSFIPPPVLCSKILCFGVAQHFCRCANLLTTLLPVLKNAMKLILINFLKLNCLNLKIFCEFGFIFFYSIINSITLINYLILKVPSSKCLKPLTLVELRYW